MPSSTPAPVKYAPLTQSTSLLRRRQLLSRLFALLCLAVCVLAFLSLVWIFYGILRQGLPHINGKFLTSFSSELSASEAGIKAGLAGSLWVIVTTFLFAVPVGVGAAVFLQEYATDSKLARFIQVNIANLAGVPSIVYGILGLAVFVRLFALQRSILAAGLTLGLLVLPIIIIAAQEALRAVPDTIRHGSIALGATRWQTISRQVFPMALPGILTGIILAISRAIGETAPLIVVGAALYVPFVPRRPTDAFTVLPMQIFHWAGHPKAQFQALAPAAIIVPMATLLALNGLAIFLRNRYSVRM